MINIENLEESQEESFKLEEENRNANLSNVVTVVKESTGDDQDDEALKQRNSSDNNFSNEINLKSYITPKESLKNYYKDENSLRGEKHRNISNFRKRHFDRNDLENREKSKLACLIRKKYTALMKDSVVIKGVRQKFKFCDSLKKLSSKIFIDLTGQIAQAVISLTAIVLYVVSTYYPDYSQLEQLKGSEYAVVNFLKWFELVISVLINVDWLINFIKSKRKWLYLLNFLNILDIIIFISVYINLIYPSKRNFGFIRVFRMIRIMRIFRFFKLVRSSKREGLDETRSEINRRLISSVLTILAVVFVATGFVHFLNDSFPEYFRIVIPNLDSYQCQSGKDFMVNEYDPHLTGVHLDIECAPGDVLVKKSGILTFDLAFYYMVITMATVGYGDIYPDTSWMRLVIGVFVIISIITISKQTSEMNDIIKLSTQYHIPYYKTKGIKHVILTGFFNKSSLIRFLNEFYHIDHKEKSEYTKIVIIHNESPGKEIQSILLDPKYEENVHFIQGDIFSENILEMAKAQTASGIILMSDHNDPEASKNDQFLILACKAFSQYTQAKLYVQFKYSQSLLHDWADWDIACSSSQIKMSMIALNGFISGFVTMIMNLSSSLNSVYSNLYKEVPWMHEYLYGATQEIYIVDIPENFEYGINLTKFILESYMTTGSLIIGIKKKVYYQDDRDIFYFVYLLNPVNVTLEKEDALIVISNDSVSAKSIFNPNKKKARSRRTTKKIKNQNEEMKALKERDKFNSFLQNFKDENIPTSILNSNKFEYEPIERKISISEKKESSNLYPFKKNIPRLFQEQQHFKIWENYREELYFYFKNHYLIFCKEEHLWEFMKCFDSFYSDIIFFVCDHHPSSQWEILMKSFPNLIFIECSYSDYDDLKKLNLEKANHVFILTYAVENSNVGDSGILPLVKLIEENFPKCKYTLELSDELNVRYLNNEGGMDEDYIKHSQRSRDSIKKDLNIKKEKEKINARMMKFPVKLWPKFAKSDIFFSSSLESLMAFSFHNDGVLEVIMKILGLSSLIRNKNIIENANISMFRYVGNQRSYTYKKVIKNFLKLSPPIIPIAVYRMHTDDNILQNEYPYIITNPKKRLDLNRFDKVICIGRSAEKVFEDFVIENYFNDEDIPVGDRSLNFKEKKKLVNVKEKKSTTEKPSNNIPISRSASTNLDENELIEKLKEELKNLKLMSRGSKIYSSNDTIYHDGNFPRINIPSNFNVIEEENYEIAATNNNAVEDIRSSADEEEKSISIKKPITEFNERSREDNKEDELKEFNGKNKNFCIINTETFNIHGNEMK